MNPKNSMIKLTRELRLMRNDIAILTAQVAALTAVLMPEEPEAEEPELEAEEPEPEPEPEAEAFELEPYN